MAPTVPYVTSWNVNQSTILTALQGSGLQPEAVQAALGAMVGLLNLVVIHPQPATNSNFSGAPGEDAIMAAAVRTVEKTEAGTVTHSMATPRTAAENVQAIEGATGNKQQPKVKVKAEAKKKDKEKDKEKDKSKAKAGSSDGNRKPDGAERKTTKVDKKKLEQSLIYTRSASSTWRMCEQWASA